MIDYYRVAFEVYERETAAAREVIRRAQARLRDTIGNAPVLQADPAFNGDPAEPNGAELTVEALIEHPQQSLLGLASAPVATDDPAPDPRRGQSGLDGRRPTRSESAGSTPAPRSTESPGSARSESTGPVGTPTPASFECDEPGCERAFASPSALGIHRGRMHGKRPSRPSPAQRVATRDSTRAIASTGEPDKRVINELCPKGCGRRFRWEPSLVTHASKCDGKPA